MKKQTVRCCTINLIRYGNRNPRVEMYDLLFARPNLPPFMVIEEKLTRPYVSTLVWVPPDHRLAGLRDNREIISEIGKRWKFCVDCLEERKDIEL